MSNFRRVECKIQTIDNETAYLIIYCLNCIRRDGNSTYKMGLNSSTKLEKKNCSSACAHLKNKTVYL